MEQHAFLAARADRWARRHPVLLDVSFTVLFWLVFGLSSLMVAGPVGLVVATATIVALAVRRRHPAAVLGWSVAMFAVQLLVVPIPLPANAAQAVVVYTVAARVMSARVRLLALGSAVTGCLAGGLRWSTPPQYARNALVIGVTLAFCAVLIWLVGELVRGGRTNRLALHEARTRVERDRRQRERMAAAAEIHDIVAHSLTVVIVQADAGAHAPSDAGTILTTIAGTARTALAEVRGVISLLHQPELADPPDDPAVSARDVRQLIESVRAAGLPVHETLPAWFDELPATVRFVVLRAVREALTNVLKHAGPAATARLTVTRRGDAVVARIEDDGVTPSVPTVPGHGLNGLRDRVRALDGTLSAGPRAGNGFEVEIDIPRAFAGTPAPAGRDRHR